MSKSLLLECDPIDQPAATDPVERKTWCCAAHSSWPAISYQESGISRFKANEQVCICRHSPVAEWLVTELVVDAERALPPGRQFRRLPPIETRLRWTQRHCLRSADSALMLPAALPFSTTARASVPNGRQILPVQCRTCLASSSPMGAEQLRLRRHPGILRTVHPVMF